MRYCNDCDKDYSDSYIDKHLKTNKHLKNSFPIKYTYQVKNILIKDF